MRWHERHQSLAWLLPYCDLDHYTPGILKVSLVGDEPTEDVLS